MKIVNKSEFYLLSGGTLYSEYEPCFFRGLRVKQSTLYYGDIPIDFIYEDLIGNIESNGTEHFFELLEYAEKNKTSLLMDFDCGERDALYEENQLYAIYEKKDLEGFIKKLQSLIS